MTESRKLKKLNEAKSILKQLGLPEPQHNNRSGWVLLSLCDIKPSTSWSDAEAPMLATHQIMSFISSYYDMQYKPNSRETIRRQTLHQFEQAGIVVRNADLPSRPTNSKDNNYSLSYEALNLIRLYDTSKWDRALQEFHACQPKLIELYQKRLDILKIPVQLPTGEKISLSPGKHNQLHADIVHEFCPRFVSNNDSGNILYIGDTASSRSEGGKLMYLDQDTLNALGVPNIKENKLPDIIAYDPARNWLYLIEAVTSHGPISPKRWIELEEMFSGCTAGLVYVTAFPDRKTFRQHSADISWETEVWISEDPDHMIHFNGDRFLGPHNK